MKTPRPHTLLRLAIAAGFAFTFGSAHAADFTSTWNSGTANWTSTGNWSTPGAPGTFPNNGGSTYDAVQSAGTITLNQNIAIQKFNLSGGTLTGTNSLTTNDTLSWSSGTMNGAGITNTYGGMALSSAANKTILGWTVNNGDGTNAATATWTGGFIDLRSGSVFNNQAGATFTTNFDGGIVSGSGVGTFNNAGTFIKSGSGGAATTIGDGYSGIPVLFNNSGTTKVMTSFLNLGSGGTSTGTFDIDSGATLRFTGGTYNSSGIVTGAGDVMFSITGSAAQANLTGTYSLTGGITANGGNGNITVTNATATSLAIDSGSANINGGTLTAATLDLSGGRQGGTGTVNVTGATTWTGGRFSDSGTTNLLGGATLSGSSNKEIFGRTVGNGDGTNASALTWTAGNIDLRSGSVFNNKANATFTTNFDGAIVSGSGASTFNNAGTFTKSGGAGTTSISDPFSGIPVTFNNTGTVNADSGTLRIDRFNMQDGTVTGAGIVSATGTFNWTGGTFAGAGALNMSSTGGTISSTAAKGLDRTLNNTGTITFTGTLGSGGQVQFGVGNSTPGIINNSGTINLSSGASFQTANANAAHAINNSGNWNVSGSFTNTVNTGIKFNNSGAVTVASNSTFVTLGGGTQTGSFSVGSGGDLWLIGSDLNSGSSVTGAGKVTLGGSTINTGSTYNTTGETHLRGGSTIFNISATTGSVTTVTGGQNTLEVNGASTTLTVTGAVTQSGGVTIVTGGAVIDGSVYNLNAGELKGNGTIASSVIAGAGSNTIAPGLSPGALTINGSLSLSSTSTLAMELGGLSQGSLYDYLDVNGALTLAGMLELNFINDFQTGVTSLDQFTLATANTDITGSFLNVASGGRLNVGSFGSFQVWYGAGSAFGANNLVLGDFTAVPEPSRAMLMMLGLFGLMQRRRRKVCD